MIASVVALIAVVIGSFLGGSFPSGWIAGRLARGTDIRQEGSGATGATNTFRLLGWKWGTAVLLIDFLKGLLPVLAVLHLLPTHLLLAGPEWTAVFSGLAAVLGHVFPPFLGFRGGKGVATGAGFMVAIFPPILPVCLSIFIAFLAVGRKASVASLSAALAAPIAYFFLAPFFHRGIALPYAILFCVLPALVLFTHRKNIARLASGSEPATFKRS